MLKHNNHLKHNTTNLIKYAIRGMGTKRSLAASKNDSFFYVKQQQYCNYNSDMN